MRSAGACTPEYHLKKYPHLVHSENVASGTKKDMPDGLILG